jgi:hypothetical protein
MGNERKTRAMSGGHFNYSQYQIMEMADQIEYLIRTNDCTDDDDEWNQGPRYTPETIEQFKKGARALREAFIYAHRIDWLVCSDDGEETFHKRLADELRSLK